MNRVFFALVFFVSICYGGDSREDFINRINAADNAETVDGPYRLSGADQKAVIQAITDEIYDRELTKQYYGISGGAGEKDKIYSIPAYINPRLDREGNGYVVYRLMPYGEVYRLFYLRKDGIVRLIGDPQIGFPITQPSQLTVYMDDDFICDARRKWKREKVSFYRVPDVSVVSAAASRQEIRDGFSLWKNKHGSD